MEARARTGSHGIAYSSATWVLSTRRPHPNAVAARSGLQPLQPCWLDPIDPHAALGRLIEPFEEVLDLLVPHGLDGLVDVIIMAPLEVRHRLRAVIVGKPEARWGSDITVCYGHARRPAVPARRLALGTRPR